MRVLSLVVCAVARAHSDFLVLSSARSGSSFFVKTLDSHREICARGELLHPEWGRCSGNCAGAVGGAVEALLAERLTAWAPPDGEPVLETWRQRVVGSYAKCGRKARGFKWFPASQGARRGDVANVAAWATASDVKFIDLRRRDVLAHVASLQRKKIDGVAPKVYAAKEGGVAFGKSDAPSAAAAAALARVAVARVNVTFARKACASLKRSRETIDVILSDVPPSRVHRVYYEDLLDERANGTWAAVLDYLGVQIAPLRTTLVRVRNASAPRFLDEDLAEATLRDAGCASHL